MDKWQAVLREHVPAARKMRLEADRSPIFEVLNVAWAGAAVAGFEVTCESCESCIRRELQLHAMLC